MLLRHSASYLLARGVPGLLNFAALAIYTRLLTPDEFGRYALVLAGAAFTELLLFQWIYLAVGRFYSAHRTEPDAVKRPVIVIFLFFASILLCIGLSAICITTSFHWKIIIATSVAMIISQAFLELNLALSSAQLEPMRFGLLLGTKSIVALIIGVTLARIGLGEIAPLIGLATGSTIASAAFGLKHWSSTRIEWPAKSILRDYFGYGFPLILSASAFWIVANSDRVLIAWFLGESAAGVYSAGYSMAQQSLGLVLATVHRATFFIALHRFETQGHASAREQMKLNGQLTFAVALSGCIGLSILSPSFVDVFVGREFQTGALEILPWIAASTVIWGIKTDYIDVAFHLARRTHWLIMIGFASAIANVLLNLALIPIFGIIGAAWAAIGATALGAVMSQYLGQKVFPSPPFAPILFRASLVSLPVFISTLGSSYALPTGIFTLVFGVIAGGIVSAAGAVALDIGGARQEIQTWLRKTRQKPCK